MLAMANGTILGRTNKKLIDIAQRRNNKRKRKKGYKLAQVLNQELLNERYELQDIDSIWRWLGDISKEVFRRQYLKKTYAERKARYEAKKVKHQAKSTAKRVLEPVKPRQTTVRGRRNPPTTPATGCQYPLSRSPTPPTVSTPTKGPATLWFEGNHHRGEVGSSSLGQLLG